MKLRFHGNSLRLRLSQPEVTQLGESGRVDETVTFKPGQQMTYTLESGEVAAPEACFENGEIRVTLPVATAKHWIDSEETGIEGSSGPLRIIVEKDFQCLHSASELEADAFPNPLADKF